jgi:hypothetical protein
MCVLCCRGIIKDSICGLVVRVMTVDQDIRVRFLALPDVLSSKGSGTAYNQLRVSAIEELLGRKSSGYSLESREYGRSNPSR